LLPLERHGTEDVKPVFEQVFARYGLPAIIRSDNGVPFASLEGPHGLTQLSAWWRTLGIKLERIKPGHPEQNGAHERMHRDLADEIEGQPSATLAEEVKRLERWRVEYNVRRPHEALGMKTPGEAYRRSSRRLSEVQPYGYPLDFAQRYVHRDGCIRIQGQAVYLSEALGKLTVGLERLDQTDWRVWFCDLAICELCLDGDKVTRRPVALVLPPGPTDCNPCPDNKVLPMSCS
jgi:hypothetical protein